MAKGAGGYVVTLPDFGYGVTQGETDEETLHMAQDLLILTSGDYIREGRPLPAPSMAKARPKRRKVPLPIMAKGFSRCSGTPIPLCYTVGVLPGNSGFPHVP